MAHPTPSTSSSLPIHDKPSASSPIASSHHKPGVMTVAQIDVATLRMKQNLQQTESKITNIQALETRLDVIIARVQDMENQPSGAGPSKSEKENEPFMGGMVTRLRSKAKAKGKPEEMKPQKMPLSKEMQEEIDRINEEIRGIRGEVEVLEEEVFRGEDKENAEWTQKIVDDLTGKGK